MVFNHSVKVPTQYKKGAAVLKAVIEEGKALKSLICNERHAETGRLQAVLKLYFDNRPSIDAAIEKSKILEENPRLCKYLCKFLTTELIIGRKILSGESKPVATVRNYQNKFIEALPSIEPAVSQNKKDLKPRYVRVNTNVFTISDALQILATEGWRKKEAPMSEYKDFLLAVNTLNTDEFMIDMHLDNLLIFHSSTRRHWACNQLVLEKKFILQDKGTCLVAELLCPPQNSILLDICAAPGMKTIHASNLMKNTGNIYAIEKSKDRYDTLCDMIRLSGAKNVKTIHADALTIDSTTCTDVEYIIVDPSCTGSGIQNRISIGPEVKDTARIEKLAGLQMKILTHAMTAFPNVKRIVYSTCSIYEEENEQVVQRCLKRCPQFKLLDGKKALRKKWSNFGDPKYEKVGRKCIYTKPESDYTDGIFIALFEKRRDD